MCNGGPFWIYALNFSRHVSCKKKAALNSFQTLCSLYINVTCSLFISDKKTIMEEDAEKTDSKETVHNEDLTNNVTFDDVLIKVGQFGPFQIVLYIMFSLPYLETAMQLLGWVFVGATPEHQCNDTGYANISSSIDQGNASNG